MALTLPKGTKPTSVLAKRAPSNKINAEYTSGYLHIDEENDVAEMHVSDGRRGAIVPLENDGPNLNNFRAGQLPAPVIALMQHGGKLIQAKDEIEVEDEANEATVIFHRDTALFDAGGDLRAIIPEEFVTSDQGERIHINAKRLMELATALGSEKLTLEVPTDGGAIRVEPFEGGGLGTIKPLERNAPPEEPAEEATEQFEGTEVPEEPETAPEEPETSPGEVPEGDDPDKDLSGPAGLTPEEEEEWGVA